MPGTRHHIDCDRKRTRHVTYIVNKCTYALAACRGSRKHINPITGSCRVPLAFGCALQFANATQCVCVCVCVNVCVGCARICVSSNALFSCTPSDVFVPAMEQAGQYNSLVRCPEFNTAFARNDVCLLKPMSQAITKYEN